MSTLVVYATKHGSTKAITEEITKTLERLGVQNIKLVSAETAEEHLDGAKNVIVGAPVYFEKWNSKASQFLEINRAALAKKKLFLFSVGGAPVPTPNVTEGLAGYEPVEQEYFRGKLLKQDLNLIEQLIIRMVKSEYGDYRNWKQVEQWANSIAPHLR